MPRERKESVFEEDFVDVDDFDKYAKTTEADLPQQQIRDTKRIQTITKSELNDRQIQCTVTQYQVSKKGLFQKRVEFSIVTDVPGMMKQHVTRTDDDFATLRKMLLTALP